MKYISLAIILFLWHPAQAQQQSPCSSSKAHEFDFWIGNWTVYKNGTDKIVGYNTIVSVAGGCGIQESWRDVSGSNIGTSLNKYEFNLGKWQQFWVDNSGQTLELRGVYTDKKMIMSSQSPKMLQRITWFNNEDGTVRQLWEQSKDNGSTWATAFDGLYKKN